QKCTMDNHAFIRYFSIEVLSIYRGQPEKYNVRTDYFEGEIETRSDYCEQHAAPSGKRILSVQFGFRSLRNGELALAVYMPSLVRSSQDELRKWAAFELQPDSLSPEYDERFEMWVRRYIKGSWSVEDGV